jgi:hypothetical protein
MKPLVIHTRAASADTLAILREEGETEGNQSGGKSAGGVFHCFTETAEVARAALDMGFYISFSGILTFKTAQDLRDVAAFVPMDRILIETDSPYLAPTPYRGKTNNPSYVPFVAQQIANYQRLVGRRGGTHHQCQFRCFVYWGFGMKPFKFSYWSCIQTRIVVDRSCNRYVIDCGKTIVCRTCR